MTEEALLLVRELKEKIRSLMERFEYLESQNEGLQRQIDSLSDRIRHLEKEKEELGSRYENLKLAKVLEDGPGGKAAARQRINKLLREIDKCVALLNG